MLALAAGRTMFTTATSAGTDTSVSRRYLRKGGAAGEHAREGATDVEDSREKSPERQRRWLCAACDAPIAAREDALAIAGSTRHSKTNPFGAQFEIVTVRACTNTALHGPPVAMYSFFSGYAWTILLCARCGTHLGWRYSSSGQSAPPEFFGLLTDRLREEDA